MSDGLRVMGHDWWLECPHCNYFRFHITDLDVGDLIIGKQLRCAGCGREFTVTGKCLKYLTNHA